MDGVAYFADYCRKNNIDSEKYFQLGKGTSAPSNGRYKVSLSCNSRKNSQLFAIQYCRDIEVFLAWDLHEGNKGTTVFSVPANMISIIGGKVNKVVVSAEYRNRGIRTVSIFKADALPEFMERYVFRGGNHNV